MALNIKNNQLNMCKGYKFDNEDIKRMKEQIDSIKTRLATEDWKGLEGQTVFGPRWDVAASKQRVDLIDDKLNLIIKYLGIEFEPCPESVKIVGNDFKFGDNLQDLKFVGDKVVRDGKVISGDTESIENKK